jgi:uncharacterized protein involved in outer membrane biogenesis
LWAIGGLLVLLVAAVLIGPGLVDWNQYKGDIQNQARNATGRELAINGDISITVLPAPALIANDVLLANVEGAASDNMIRLKHLEVRVAMVPLLAGRVEVERIKLVNPEIELEVLADGRKNWIFDTDGPGTASQAIPGAPSDEGKGGAADEISAPAIVLNNFTIENGTLIYRDRPSGTTERIDKINANIAAASLNGPFESTGDLRLRGVPLVYDVNVAEIIHGRTVPFNLKLGMTPGQTKLQMTGTVVGLESEPKVKGKIKGEGASLAGLIQAAMPGAALPGIADQAFAVEGAALVTAAGAEIKELNFRLGKTQATGDIAVDLGQKPTVAVRLAANRIDLDQLLSLPAVIAKAPGNEKAAAEKSSAEKSKAAAPVPAAPFALPANVNGSVIFTAEAITYRNGVIREAVMNAELANGEVTLSQLSGQFPGGSDLALFGFLSTAKGQPRFEGELETTVSDLRGVMNWLGVEPAGIGPDRLRKLALASRVVAVPSHAQLTGLDLQLDSSRLTGGVTVAFSKRPSFGADFTIDRLNLDAYLPKSTGKKEKAAPKNKAGAPKAKDAQGDTKVKPAENPLAGLKVLTGVDANLKTRIKNLTFQGAPIKNVFVDGTLYNGQIEIRRLNIARMAGASVSLKGVIDGLGEVPTVKGLAFEVKADDVPKLLKFAGIDAGAAPKGLGTVTLKGRIDGNLLAPKLNITMSGAGATAKVSGHIDGLGVLPVVKGLKIQLKAKDASRVLKLAGIEAPALKKLGAVDLSGVVDGNFLSPSVAMTLKAAGGSVRVQGPVNMLPVGDMLDMTVNAEYPKLSRLLRALGGGYRPAGKVGGLNLEARLRGGPKGLTLSGIKAKIGPTPVNGDVVVGLGRARPDIKANLTAGALILDPFLPAKKTASLWPGVRARPAARTAAPWSRDPIDLSGLAGIDAALALKSPSIQYDRYRLDNADVSVKLANGRLIADKLTGVLFGGALHAIASATTTARPRVETVFALENMSVGQATRALTGKAAAAGRMSLKARLKSAGSHMAGMIGGLNGDGVLRLKDVDVKQGKTGTALAGALGLVSALNQFSGVLGGGARRGSGLVDIAGSFAIRNGVASSRDMKLTSNLGNGTATGTVDLPRWYIDVKGHVQLGQNVLTALLASRARTDVTQAVPFTVRGRLDKPNINLDTSKLPGGALPIPGVDKLLKKAPKGVGAILQGILGGGVPQQRSQPPPPGSEPPPPQPQPQPRQRQITPEDLLKDLFRRR